MDGEALAGKIDFALLKVDSQAHVEQLRAAVETTVQYGFRTLTVPPVLAGTVKQNFPELRVCAVVSYPLGLDTLAAKLYAVEELIDLGIDELDVVYDLFALVNDNRRKLELEAERLGNLTARAGVFHKAIIETPILTDEQIRWAGELLADSPVDCVKTSTGYHREPTTPDHVRLLRSVVRELKQLKAAGGIRNLYQARALLDAGADILGTSSAVKIIQELRAASRTEA